MSLFLCMVLESVLVSFFYKCWPVFPAPLVKEIVFTPLYILASFVKDKVSIDLSLGFLFGSIELYFCLCASTVLSWWLWLCSRAWSQADWFLQFHSSFSRLLWLFEVFCISIQTVKLFVLVLWSKPAFRPPKKLVIPCLSVPVLCSVAELCRSSPRKKHFVTTWRLP